MCSPGAEGCLLEIKGKGSVGAPGFFAGIERAGGAPSLGSARGEGGGLALSFEEGLTWSVGMRAVY